MIAAADSGLETVAAQHVVVNALEALNVCEHMTNEVTGRLCTHQPAQRHLQILTAPTALETSPRSSKAFSQKRCPPSLEHDFVPERRQQRLKWPVLRERPNTLCEACENVFILDRALLVWDFAVPIVERNLDQLHSRLVLFPQGNTQRRGFGRIAIDNQAEGHSAVPAGQSAQPEVLDPDAGVEQLRLMASDEEDIAIALGDGFAGLPQIGTRGTDGGSTRFPSQLGERPTQDDDVRAIEKMLITFQKPAGFREWRFSQDGAILRRRPQTHAPHRRGPRRQEPPSSSERQPASSAAMASPMTRR